LQILGEFFTFISDTNKQMQNIKPVDLHL
jgi:hypothetical protein